MQDAVDEIERSNPDFKKRMRSMALKRAERFGFDDPGNGVV